MADVDDNRASGPAPWLSVLVPVYNVLPYLRICVDSVLSQADEGVEIVLCDDCSTDGSDELARTIAEGSPWAVRFMQNPANRGLSATRNAMLENARGEYVWFLDSDDFLLPGAIPAVRSAIAQHQPDLIGGNYVKRLAYNRGFKGPANTLISDRNLLVEGTFRSRKMYAWLRVSRRTLWQDGLRFPEGKLFEDAHVTPRLLLEARSYLHVPQTLLRYRRRAGSIMAQVRRPPEGFHFSANNDLAHSLDGYAGALAEAGVTGRGALIAVSHFLATEFHKIVGRLRRNRIAETASIAAEFRQIMEAASPMPFEELTRHYLRTGRLVAYVQLSRALEVSRRAIGPSTGGV